MLKDVFVPIHPDGYKFIGIFAAITLVLWFIAQPLGFLGLILTLWCVYFFRNPNRITPQDKNLVISAADGKVVHIDEVSLPKELQLEDRPYRRISVFLNVFDVHVNKMPLSGIIQKMNYIKGKFINASLDKASEDNERLAIALKTDIGAMIGVVQIAGLVARRICWDVEEGDRAEVGKNYGLIRFGSRVDIYIPAEWPVKVMLGQTMIAGETVLAIAETN
ncbi:MAG: phosphatidylserine decarboxylase [Alphaproteobacteria bacterium]|nr:phosphatidylserine decarboxylase [Alphaproteobacteria bacterium]